MLQLSFEKLPARTKQNDPQHRFAVVVRLSDEQDQIRSDRIQWLHMD